MRQKDLQDRNNQGQHAVSQNISRTLPLVLVFGAHEVGVPAANSDPGNDQALTFKRLDFASDKGVADLRILVDEVSDVHVYLYSMREAERPSRRLRRNLS